MLNKSTKLHNKSSNTETDHKMNPAVKFATSEENGGAEKIINNISDDEELEIVKCYSNISSLYDDSEFSSSSNEDREDVVNRLLEHNFGFHTVAGLVKGKMNTKRHSSPNLLLESNQNNRVHVCLGLTTSGTLIQDSDKMQITKNQMDTHKNTNLVFLKRCRRIVGLDTISNNNSSNRNLGAVRSRQRIDNTNSLVNSAAQTNHRAPRNDRHRSEDVNNNAAGYRHLTSYLKKAPFKFQDCFQDQGLLSLVACISYTLILMIIFCLLGVILDSLKSVIGTENLKDLRANIAQSRRTRTSMSSG